MEHAIEWQRRTDRLGDEFCGAELLQRRQQWKQQRLGKRRETILLGQRFNEQRLLRKLRQQRRQDSQQQQQRQRLEFRIGQQQLRRQVVEFEQQQLWRELELLGRFDRD